MADRPSIGELNALISSLIAHGKTGNMRAVVQLLNDIEKKTKGSRDEGEVKLILAKAYRHALDPMGVGKKFRDVENFLDKIESLEKEMPESEEMQEIYSEALNSAIFHNIKNEREKDIHRNLKKLGSFASNHQQNPFVQFNYAMSLSEVASYFSENDDREVTYNLLWEIIGLVTFYPGNEILTQVSDGLLECVTTTGSQLSLKELEELATRIDEFINFTNEFDIQQKLTACQGKIFQYMAGQRMRVGYSPDGKIQSGYRK
jgi:hypothetical protein